MNDLGHDPPIACSLTSAEFRDHEARILARFKAAVIATEELPGGYAFRLPGDKESIMLIADLIVAERECCPFLSFQLATLPNMGPAIVRAVGPQGTKEFVRTILCTTDGST